MGSEFVAVRPVGTLGVPPPTMTGGGLAGCMRSQQLLSIMSLFEDGTHQSAFSGSAPCFNKNVVPMTDIEAVSDEGTTSYSVRVDGCSRTDATMLVYKDTSRTVLPSCEQCRSYTYVSLSQIMTANS